jgi:hypothetical protein
MLVLDFDGTLTDAEEEGRPFRDGYLEDIATLCGGELNEVHRLADEFGAEIMANLGTYGWNYMGHVVAPASVDPYLRIMPVARKILDHYGAIASETDRSRLLDGILYKYNYRKSAIAFRDGAYEFLSGRAGTATWVVTNSATKPVQDKVSGLAEAGGTPGSLDWLVDRVFGFGKKYVLDMAWDAVPESMQIDGLKRPVYLRRHKYFEVLDRLRQEAGVDWDGVTVVGDIFELDLALPLHLGARVGLMVNEFTPTYEKAWLAEHPRAALLGSLAEVPGFLE